jgi:hypothetical protein
MTPMQRAIASACGWERGTVVTCAELDRLVGGTHACDCEHRVVTGGMMIQVARARAHLYSTVDVSLRAVDAALAGAAVIPCPCRYCVAYRARVA